MAGPEAGVEHRTRPPAVGEVKSAGPALRARPTISVLICAYTDERWSEIVAAIQSVRGQRLKATEIVLVIDHNPDLYARACWTFPDVTVVENSQCPGLSGARNTGTAICRGEVVAFLDDDAVARPSWLRKMATHFAEPDVVGVGGLVAPWWEKDRPAWFPVEFDWVVGCSHSGMPSTTATVRNFVGANMSFRREALDELGGFSADLGRSGANAAGCEETELCIRAASWEGGSRLVYDPDAAVRHHVPASRATWTYFLRRCYGEGRSKATVSALAGKREGLASERAYLTHTLPSGIARGLRDGLTGKPGGFGRALAIVLGTLAAVLGYLGIRTSSGIQTRVTAGAERYRNVRAIRAFQALTWDGAGIARARANDGSLTRGVAQPSPMVTRVGLPLFAIGLWAIALVTSGAPASMNDLGLLSILSPAYYLAIAVVLVGFGMALRSLDTKVLAAHLVVLLAIFHLTPAILYGTLRYTWAWKHVAITNYVIAHHGVDLSQHIPSLVAYQDWPGFFTLQGLLSSAAGLSSPITYANWWPFVNELAYAGPFLLIVRTFTRDRRTEWIALLLFFLGDWIGQDYFSPQGEAYFFYLVLIAVVLKYFRTRTSRSDTSNHVVEIDGFAP
ncbi:MAG TPA: glycosyltransferase, partial [Acidimicrobiales bacterium]|nr:glycosyltransferase [Acidimicrobiales bacterium]